MGNWRRLRPSLCSGHVGTRLDRSGLSLWARAGFLAAVGALLAGAADAPDLSPGAPLDLAGPFGTRSPWQLTVSQGPEVQDPGDNEAPGVLTLCLRRGASGPCDPALREMLSAPGPDAYFAEPHYLNLARIVRPHGAARAPMLLVQTASVHAGDGDQAVLTQALAYAPYADRFKRVYEHVTGANNDQETRFIASRPLQGDIVSVDPTEDAPFGFWVVVSAPSPAGAYRQVLRYRSATRYADGNPLAVIDSEMVGIEQRLGVWRAGMALPVPAGCVRPRLLRGELWCR